MSIEGNIHMTVIGEVICTPRDISANHVSHCECTVNWRACYLCDSIKCLAVQRTVVPGNWMDSRQSDNSIVPMIASNAEGGKGVAKGYISRQKPSPYSGTDEWGLTQSGKKA